MFSKPDDSLRPNRPLICICACLLFALASSGCHRRAISAAKPSPSSAPAASPHDLPDEEMTGLASWYGHPYHGRRTSSGETYNMHDLTAAHRTLPFDTMVWVSNLENGKQVQVRINDRGPFVEDRVIDLSFAAAKAIDLVGSGTARVSLKIVHATNDAAPLAVQVGSFQIYDNAVRLKEEIGKNFSPVFIEKFDSPEGLYFRVLFGEFDNYVSASEALQELRNARHDGFIIRREF